MNILNNIKNFLYDRNYFIGFYKENIYIFNYIAIPIFSDQEIKISFEEFNIMLKGNNLKIIKMEDKELLINGNVKNIGINYEK